MSLSEKERPTRRDSVKYSLQYVLSALDTLGLDEDNEEVVNSETISVSTKAKIDITPILTTLRAIGDINDFQPSEKDQSRPYSLEYILATLETLGEADEEENADWDYKKNGGLNEKQVSSMMEIEDIVSSLTAFEKSNSRNDLQMMLSDVENQQAANPTPKPQGFDLQFVLSSINALGEDEESQETYLHSLNPARKNSLVKCNLQYVLTLLRSLGRVDTESAKNAGSSKSKKYNTAEPKNGVDKISLSSKNNDNNMSNKDDDASDDNWRTSISQSAVSFGTNAHNSSSNHDALTHSKSFQSDSKSCNDSDNNSNYCYTSSCKERSVKG